MQTICQTKKEEKKWKIEEKYYQLLAAGKRWIILIEWLLIAV